MFQKAAAFVLHGLVAVSALRTGGKLVLPEVAHEGTPVGTEVKYDNLTLYVTGGQSDTAILYLTDVFGVQLPQNKLLADTFGRAGYRTIVPDLFDGNPAPGDIVGTPSFNVTEFLNWHRPEITEPKIQRAIRFIQNKLKIDKIAVVGYCFGGRYAFRLLGQDSGVQAAFAAHPSLLQDSEITGISGPVSVAFAETDGTLPIERRHKIEQLLIGGNKTYSLSLYSGTNHGFAVRANISDPEEKFAKEQAAVQAIIWFNQWA